MIIEVCNMSILFGLRTSYTSTPKFDVIVLCVCVCVLAYIIYVNVCVCENIFFIYTLLLWFKIVLCWIKSVSCKTKQN